MSGQYLELHGRPEKMIDFITFRAMNFVIFFFLFNDYHKEAF